jgi:metallo-beta-lactamase family protein
MPLLLKFHGALTTVTGSCHFFKIKASGNIYAVDCGATQGEDDDEQLAHPRHLPHECTPDKLSGIILTHAHGDHINHLPRWFQAGFKGQIFCTKETAKLAEIALPDSNRIECREGKDSADDASLARTLDALKSARHVQPGAPVTIEHNVTIQAAPTSHLLGSCAFRIVATDGGKTASVLFTGDIGPVEQSDETLSLYAERAPHPLPADFVISESTYGSRPRDTDRRSGRKRQARICEMLSKAFRHGDTSLVVVPAFSLQRTLDVLADIFCILQYQRSAIGLSKSIIPIICIPSGLSFNYAQAYRDFLFDELSVGPCFFNEQSLLIQTIKISGDDAVGVLNELIPSGKRSVAARMDEDHNLVRTEIVWGKPNLPTGAPTIVICGTGMTQGGYVTELMDQFLTKEDATFVLCGYVPPRSPGSQLRQISPLSRADRATLAVKIPKDKQSGRPAKAIPGDEIKCGFETVSEYYSGHADGPSIVRYLLGDNLERVDQTKGIFLVHGDKGARGDLRDLIYDVCHKAGRQAPEIFCPTPHGLWFDCETGRGEGEETGSSMESEFLRSIFNDVDSPALQGDTLAQTSLGLIETETCVILNNPIPAGEAIELIKGAFDFARPEVKGNGLLLRFSRLGRPLSTVLVEADRIGTTLLKLSVQTKIKQAERIEDIADLAFDWRRPLNLLGVDKELYYAGVRWCETDAEVERLLAICTPSVYVGKQRRQPVLLLHKETLNAEQLLSIERLLTPAVVVAVVNEQALSRINTYLGLQGVRMLCKSNPIYLPIKFAAGTHSVTAGNGGLDIGRLTGLVTADTYILYAREPQLSGIGQLSPLINPVPETAEVLPTQMLVKARAATSVKDRTQLPLETFLELAVGQKVLASVEYVRIKATTGAANFALLRLKNLGISGMLHCTQMAGPFQASVGDTIEVWIRQVMPERREVVFTQYQVRLPGDPLIHTVAISHLSPTGIADMLLGKATVDAACRAAEEINRLQGLPPLPARPDTTLSKRTAIGTYNRLIESLGLIDTPSIPAPELAQGLTYGDVAKELGYDIEHIINAAGHMIGDTETYHLGMSILPSGFTPTETSAFPAEHKEAFIRECLERADKNWSKQLDLEAALKPDCLSLAHLAKQMGISEAELLTLMTEKGIQPKVQVVLSKDDIKALESHSDRD